jgi:hypothetical protein
MVHQAWFPNTRRETGRCPILQLPKAAATDIRGGSHRYAQNVAFVVARDRTRFLCK